MKQLILISGLTMGLLLPTLFAQTITYDFSQSSHNFAGGVSDFSVEQSGQHQFTFEHIELPLPFPAGQLSLYVSGFNPSDDLFMYLKRKLTGLQPNTTYLVTFDVEFASIYPTNAIGVGGPPGEGVTMKAGMTLIEPDTLVTDKGGPFVIMNIDKGNQSQPGADMDTIGHVGVSDTTTVYTLKTNNNLGRPFTFSTDGAGEGWVIVGTDSGFESTTAIYYTRITLDLEIVSSNDDILPEVDVMIFPNPSAGEVRVYAAHHEIQSYQLYELASGKKITQGDALKEIRFNLTQGMYALRLQTVQGSIVKKFLVQ